MFSGNGADVMVESGAALVVQKNTATSQHGGGVYLQEEGSTFTATGNSTRVTVESNTAEQVGGGVYSAGGADVMVESGAALVVQTNTATSLAGGGLSVQDEGSTFTATGDNTRVTVESNTAEQIGGGIFSLDGADVMIKSGAALVVQYNKAVFEGAGIALASRGTSLSVVGRDTRLHVLDNMLTSGDVGISTTASRSGAGLAVGPGASAVITSPSLFRGNRADAGAGGAVAFTGVGEDDGAAACVSVDLEINGNKSTATGYGKSGRIRAWTFPLSALDSRDDDWARLVENSPSQWCIPCGEYFLIVGTGYDGVGLGHGALVRLRLARLSGSGPVLEEDTTSLITGQIVSLPISLPCSEQGVRIANARFENNTARDGGALGVAPDRTKNSFFDVTDSVFVGNTATRKGGAVHLSGVDSGARLAEGCVFRANRVGEDGFIGKVDGGGQYTLRKMPSFASTTL